MEKNRKRMCAIIVLAITICASTVIPDFAIDVQAATGESNEMIYGADIGFLSQLESQGVQWIDDAGNTRGCTGSAKGERCKCGQIKSVC